MLHGSTISATVVPFADTPLQILLMGPPTLIQHQQPMLLARRQARALFYRIAAAPHPLPRDQLCFLLWPDTPETMARRNLTVLLAQLRRALPDPHLFVVTNDEIGLDAERVQIDVMQFAREVPAALHHQQFDRLAELVRLYRGPFLHGFSLPASAEYDSWIEQERQVWERRYLDALAALVEGYSLQGDYAAAIGVAQQVLTLDELAEDMHRRLIELYAASGDRSAALRQFERCAVVLERELGVSPLPETRAVYEAVRDGQIPLRERKPRMLLTTREVTIDLPPQAEAPPTQTLRRATIPPAPTPLIGRAAELNAARALLADTHLRLVTLYGPGGSGKTRLAIQLAWDLLPSFTDGVVFVALAPLQDPALVLTAIAQACDLQETDSTPLAERVRHYLQDKHLLLVLDNCEHLLDAVPIVAEVVQGARQVRILTTSRARLNVQCEHTLFVPPLPLPDLEHLPPTAALADEPAVALLLARTQASNPNFQLTESNAADLAAICVRLDGLPLAIELAAARLKLLAPKALLKRLDHRLALLTTGPRDLPDRQQTLRATIDWSYRLLDADERAFFAQLAVFAGGWSLEAAEALAPGQQMSLQPAGIHVLDLLTSLVDKSLVQQTIGSAGEPRFVMFETIREYALERLEERGATALAAREHATYFCAYVEAAAPHLTTLDAPRWLARLDDEYANLVTALDWLDQQGERDIALRFVNALSIFWMVRGCLHEGRHWLARTLPADDYTIIATGCPRQATLIAQTLTSATELCILQGDYVAAADYEQTGVMLWRTLGNQRELAKGLILLSAAYALGGDLKTGLSFLHEGEALAEALGDPEALAWIALQRGRTARHRGEMAAARHWLEQGLAYYRQQNEFWTLGALLELATVLLACGDEVAAATYAEEALMTSRALGNQTVIAYALNDLGELARYRGEYAQAETHYTESLQILRHIGNQSGLPRLLHNLAYVALWRGDVAQASQIFHESLTLFDRMRTTRGVAEGLAGLASVAAVQGQPLRAARLWGAAEAIFAYESAVPWPPDQIEQRRYVAQARASSDALAFEENWQAGRALTYAQALLAATADEQHLLTAE